MTVIIRNKQGKEEVLRMISRIENRGGQYYLSFKFKDYKQIIGLDELIEVLD